MIDDILLKVGDLWMEGHSRGEGKDKEVCDFGTERKEGVEGRRGGYDIEKYVSDVKEGCEGQLDEEDLGNDNSKMRLMLWQLQWDRVHTFARMKSWEIEVLDGCLFALVMTRHYRTFSSIVNSARRFGNSRKQLSEARWHQCTKESMTYITQLRNTGGERHYGGSHG